MELYKKYRPKKLKDLVGQPEAVKVLTDMVKKETIPHALLLTGPSGCGKTTVARILKSELDCSESDFTEVNAADFRGIDSIRDIRSRMNLAPMGGSCRIWLVDEAHKLTNDAQSVLLKMLEDTPQHVYFMLATTDPNKLIKTIHTRCTEIRVKPLSGRDIQGLVKTVADLESVDLGEEVLERIAETAEGSARKALVLLDSVIGLKTADEMIECIRSSSGKVQAIELARLLLQPRSSWPEVATVLKGIKDEDPESLRAMVLSYMTSVLLGGGKMSSKAFQIIQSFRDNFYDSKYSGLVAACYEVIMAKGF